MKVMGYHQYKSYYFSNDDKAFQAAVDAGEIQVETRDGKKVVVWGEQAKVCYMVVIWKLIKRFI